MSSLPKNKTLFRILIVFAAAAFLSTACGVTQKFAKSTPTAVPTIEIPTATPLPPDRVVLVAPADADPTLVANAQAVLTDLSASSGLEFETRPEITEDTLSKDLKIVVFLSHPDNLGTLAAKAPGTQFVAISSLNWTPPANVTLIHEDENDATFLAGYTAAFLAPNFRVGALLPAEDPSLDLAFQNGVAYYCGTCSSQITPLQSYPIVSVQSGSSTPDVWQAAFDQINLNKINVLYVAKAAMSTQLLSYLASKDVAVIANEATPDASFTNWAATIDLDPITPLKEIWNDLLAGTGGKSVNATFTVTDNHQITLTDGSVWLGPGKIRLVNEMIDLMRDNQIDTQAVN
jgi:hypothetical protein